tara:strand:+ start:1894 stop:2994 length:1101 start_codon:yes stop_codon:yes gene_type:complete
MKSIDKELIIFMPSIEMGGGVEKNFLLLTNFLVKKIKKISIITASKKYKKYLNNKVRYISLNTNILDQIGRRKKFFLSLIILLKKLIISKNVTVLSFQGHIYCVLLCKLFNVRVIIRSNTSPFGWSNNFLKKILYKFIYSLADEIIVNSLEFKKEMKTKLNLDTKIIYNPLNFSQINKISKEKIDFKFFKKNSLNLINVARLNEQKDQITLLKSINYLKKKISIKLLIIGNGEEKKKMINFINNNKLSKNVKILSYKKNPFPYILKSDLFVLSSRYEGLPNILLETIVLKIPILSSDCSTGPKEILDNGLGGLLFKKENYKDLAKKIIFFNQNKKVITKKTNYAYRRLFRFDYNTNLQKYFKIVSN